MNFDYIFKVVVVGLKNIGKSSLVRSNHEYDHIDCMDTLGVHFQTIFQVHNNLRIQLQLWNVKMSSKFKQQYHSYLQGARGYILYFEKSDKESFKNLNKWIKVIRNFRGSNTPIILIGHQSGLENLVNEKEIESFMKKNKLVKSYLSYNDTKNERDLIFKVLIKQIMRSIESYKTNNKVTRDPLEIQHLYDNIFQA